MKLDLQFFAEEEVVESVENQGVAEPEVEHDEVVEEPQQTVDVNAIAAAARRKAEESTKRAIDSQIAQRFKDYKNPLTGEAINSVDDYLRALDAQTQARAEEQLKENGVDPSIISQLVSNHPAVREANLVKQEMDRFNAERAIEADVIELSKIDPSITSLDSVPQDVIKKAMDTGLRLTDAYKILNYGRTSEATQAAIQQRAINQAKSKGHMTPVDGVATPDSLVEIPASELARWKETFPDKSVDEIKKLYNKTL